MISDSGWCLKVKKILLYDKISYFYLFLIVINSLYIFRKMDMEKMNIISFLLSKKNDLQIIFPSIF